MRCLSIGLSVRFGASGSVGSKNEWGSVGPSDAASVSERSGEVRAPNESMARFRWTTVTKLKKSMDEDGVLNFIIPTTAVSSVIGKKGSTVKEIVRKTRCRISISEGIVVAVGGLSQRLRAVEEIRTIVPFDFIMLVPEKQLGLVIGKSGSRISDIAAKTSTQLSFARECRPIPANVPANGPQKELTILGDGVLKAVEMVLARLRPRREARPLMFEIPRRDVGGYIGRDGSHVRELERLSGARISIDSHDAGPSTVTFRGTMEENVRAYQLSIELLDDLHAPKHDDVP